MPDWQAAQKKAALTAKWAVTMTKVRIRKTIARTRWQLVTFTGSKGVESVGIVDMIAIRKDHAKRKNCLRRGDLFEIVLIQVKGGGAPFPSEDEVARLRHVAESHDAKAVLPARWQKGKQAFFCKLHTLPGGSRPAHAWQPIDSPADIFH